MRRRVKKYLTAVMYLFMATCVLFSCRPKQEVSPIISPDNYPLATFTTNNDLNNINKGDTLVFNISLDQMMKESLSFGIKILSGSVASEDAFEVSGGLMASFTTETILTVYVIQDNFPEDDKQLEMEIGVFEIGQRYLLNPATANPIISTLLKNVNNSIAITVSFGWEDPENETDFDLLVVSEDFGAWSADGATSNNPEVDLSVWTIDPDGNYFFGFDPYDVPNEVNNYTLRVGHPDGTVEVFEGVIIESTIAEDFIADNFDAWGIPSYRLLSVSKTGSSYVVTHTGN